MSETDSEAGAATTVEPAATPAAAPARTDAKFWRGQIAEAKRNVDDRLRDWQINVDFRVQRPFGGDSSADDGGADRVAVPEDWARTRQKTAQLAFQLPKIIADARRPQFEPAAPTVSAAVNKILDGESRANYMIDECLADGINAAGIMVSKVGIDIRYEEVDEPQPPRIVLNPLAQIDPTQPGTIEVPADPPTLKVKRKVSQRIYWDRISPADFLWPREFRLSDWDKAPWLGFRQRALKSDVRVRFNLGPDVEFGEGTATPKTLADNVTPKHGDATDEVEVIEIWYYAARLDGDTIHPDCIRTIIFVDGIEKPVFHGDTTWQEWVPAQTPPPAPAASPAAPPVPGAPTAQAPPPAPPPSLPHYLGLRKLPIRVATLTYVSDMAVPPSDSAAARPQVREMIRSRSQMIRQRDHSIPIRWYDTNRVDSDVIEAIRQGHWQDMIPTNGGGDRAIGEVARANYPRENFQFQNVIGGDLDRAWSLSSNQLATPSQGIRSAAEVKSMGGANDTRLEYEKSRVNRYIAEGAEVVFMLLQRFMDDTMWVKMVGPEGLEVLRPVNAPDLVGEFDFSFKADSSDRVDVGARLDRAIKTYNLMANSPTCNRAAWEREIVELSGFDPAKFITQPKEKGPEPANVSYRFSGEDLLNPIAIAIMLASGITIGQKEIQAAQMMISDAIKGMPNQGGPNALNPQQPGPPPVPVGPGTQPPALEPPQPPEVVTKRMADGTRNL